MGTSDTGPAAQEGAKAVDRSHSFETRRPITPSERLPRGFRLRRAAEVHRVLGRGSRFRTANLDIAWIASEAGHPRLGLVVPKFQSNAVARNRLRRRLKEIWRRRGLPRLGAIDVVIRVKRAAYGASWTDLAAAIGGWLAEFGSGPVEPGAR
jgi:ribonuclease P protein component